MTRETRKCRKLQMISAFHPAKIGDLVYSLFELASSNLALSNGP